MHISNHQSLLFGMNVSIIVTLIGFSTFTATSPPLASAVNHLIDSNNNNTTRGNDIPNAQSVFNTGAISLPSSAKGFIIYIPDEAHHPPTDNKTISAKNANYIPTSLIIPKGTAIAFVHGDPNHIHVEIIKDSNSGAIAWQTIPVSHPGGSDVKVLAPGSYDISDKKYAPMKGTIKVDGGKQSNGDLVVGGIFVPTNSLAKYKSDFASAGFQILSDHNFISKTAQKDINGPTTLLIYSTNLPIQDAITKLKPLMSSLPYL